MFMIVCSHDENTSTEENRVDSDGIEEVKNFSTSRNIESSYELVES